MGTRRGRTIKVRTNSFNSKVADIIYDIEVATIDQPWEDAIEGYQRIIDRCRANIEALKEENNG